MIWLPLIAIIISLLFIGFFAGIEIAFVSANRLSIELNKKKGENSGKVWGLFAEKPTRFIGTTLIGFTIVFVIYGLLWSNFLHPILHNNYWVITNPYFQLLVETTISTIVLLFCEFSFRAFFKARNNSILNNGFLSSMALFFFNAFNGIAKFLVNIAEWILQYVFNVKINTKKEMFSKVDLEHFILQSKANEEENANELNNELFENALSLRDVKIRECLIPRKEIESVESSASIDIIKEKFIQTQLSKLVVYNENIDNIIGYIHQLDLFKKPLSLNEILLPIPVVPESMSATDLMNKFSKERKSIAWVIDEFGGTAGIVTMEDILEEIFGDIKDEFDTEDFVDKQLSLNEYIFSGRLELDFIEEKYKLSFLKDNDAETLSGYIIQHKESIPKLKERVIIGNYEFDILNVSDTRIEMAKLKVLK